MPPVSDYLMMFTTGLLGSAHCIGMCGGFVLMYSAALSGPQAAAPRALWAAHGMYNMGRVLTYSTVGGVMGVVGSFIEAAGRLRGVQGAVLALAGAFMVFMGLNMLGLAGRPGLLESRGLSEAGPFRRAFARLVSAGRPSSVLPLGLLLGLIPCGLSYTMWMKAASSGGFAQGFTLMAAFGLGTVPALAGAGSLYAALDARLRGRLYRLAAALVVLMGVQALMRGAASAGLIAHGPLW